MIECFEGCILSRVGDIEELWPPHPMTFDSECQEVLQGTCGRWRDRSVDLPHPRFGYGTGSFFFPHGAMLVLQIITLILKTNNYFKCRYLNVGLNYPSSSYL